MLNQSAAARVVVGSRASGVSEARAVLRNECRTQRAEPGITNRRRGRDDEFPVSCLTSANLGRPLQKLRSFILAQCAGRPSADVETILLVLIKFASDLGEIAAVHRVAGLVIGVIAPHPQRHSIARVGQRQFAIRFLVAG